VESWHSQRFFAGQWYTDGLMKQLPLNIHLRDAATFENFYVGKNALVLTYLEALLSKTAGYSRAYLFGNQGTGRSHLLQAACYQANMLGYTAVYLPLNNTGHDAEISLDIFEGLDNIGLVCIDDIQAIAGQPAWEEALFHFYNRSEAAQNQFIITGNKVPDNLGLKLPDLASRLNACVRFQVQSLNDDEKRSALQQRAKARGLVLSNEVGDFLLHHYSRDMSTLFTMLEQLDQASLVAQRKLTIPFIKAVLNV
jgi:DnaA-homolog protein